GKIGISALDNGVAVLKTLPDGPDAVRFAVHASPEGHWSFANRNGDVFTAADADEMKRVVPNLAPDAALEGKADQLALYLDVDTLFKNRDRLTGLVRDLPGNTRLHITIDKTSYRLVERTRAGRSRYAVRIRQNVEVPLRDPALVGEAVWQMSRALNKADIRVVALDERGADGLRSVPSMLKGGAAAQVDRLKPDSLLRSLSDVPGQTVLLKGRIDGDQFVFTPTGGVERRLSVAEITGVATRSDVNLVFLQSNAARQPGGRNWFWQTVEVDGLKSAVARPTYADFLNALAGDRGPFTVTVRRQGHGQGRVTIQAAPSVSSSPGSYGGVVDDIGSWIGTVTSEVTGNVVTSAVTADLNSESRQRELDRRLVPGVPSTYQFLYLAGIVAGLLGWSTSRSWWRYIWKKETRADYGNAAGYYAARCVKALAYVFLFLPIVGLPAVVVQALLHVWNMIMIPFRFFSWLFGKVTVRA
ncbi:MAG: hypothetical protein AAFO75_01045, partial [Pseudomonadota bacterium]